MGTIEKAVIGEELFNTERFKNRVNHKSKWETVKLKKATYSGNFYETDGVVYLLETDIRGVEFTDTNTRYMYTLKVRTDGANIYPPEKIIDELSVVRHFRENKVSYGEYTVLETEVKSLIEEETGRVLGHYYIYTLKINRNVFACTYRQKFVAVNAEGGVYDNGFIELEEKYAKDYPDGAMSRLNVQTCFLSDYTPKELMKIAKTTGKPAGFIKYNSGEFTHYTLYLKPAI